MKFSYDLWYLFIYIRLRSGREICLMSLSVKDTQFNPLLQVPGIAELGLKPRKIKKVAVVGGGLMGSGIVTALVLSGYTVLLKEINDKFLQTGLGRVKGTFVVLWLAVETLFDIMITDVGSVY